MKLETVIKEGKGTIVDVRTPGEFMGGNVKGSINIPLQEIPSRLDELKNLKQPLVLCCASGARSGNAEGYLSQVGFECMNAGPWYMVDQLVSKN